MVRICENYTETQLELTGQFPVPASVGSWWVHADPENPAAAGRVLAAPKLERACQPRVVGAGAEGLPMVWGSLWPPGVQRGRYPRFARGTVEYINILQFM